MRAKQGGGGGLPWPNAMPMLMPPQRPGGGGPAPGRKISYASSPVRRINGMA